MANMNLFLATERDVGHVTFGVLSLAICTRLRYLLSTTADQNLFLENRAKQSKFRKYAAELPVDLRPMDDVHGKADASRHKPDLLGVDV